MKKALILVTGLLAATGLTALLVRRKRTSSIPYVGSEISWASWETFKFGAETYGSDPVLNAKREVDLLKEAGANIVSMSMEKGTFEQNTAKYDEVINYARGKGMTLLLKVFPEPGTSIPISEFEAYAVAVASRYKPAFMEAYNEPFSPCSATTWQRVQEAARLCATRWLVPQHEAEWVAAIRSMVQKVHQVSPNTKVGAESNVGKFDCGVLDTECYYFQRYANIEKSPYDWLAIEPINKDEAVKQFAAVDLYWDRKLPFWVLGLDPGAAGGLNPDNDALRSESISYTFLEAAKRGFRGFLLFCTHDHGYSWGQLGANHCGILDRVTWLPKNSYNVLKQLISARARYTD